MFTKLRAKLAAWIAPATPAPAAASAPAPTTDNTVRGTVNGLAAQIGQVHGDAALTHHRDTHTHHHDAPTMGANHGQALIGGTVNGGMHYVQNGGIGTIGGSASTVIGSASGPLNLGGGTQVNGVMNYGGTNNITNSAVGTNTTVNVSSR